MRLSFLAATLFSVVFLAAFGLGARAQDDKPAPTPTPTETPAPAASPAPPTRFWLEVDQNELAVISQALGDLPYKLAAPLVMKLNAQLAVQSKIVENKDEAQKPKRNRK